jgi:hypothetical protein
MIGIMELEQGLARHRGKVRARRQYQAVGVADVLNNLGLGGEEITFDRPVVLALG